MADVAVGAVAVAEPMLHGTCVALVAAWAAHRRIPTTQDMAATAVTVALQATATSMPDTATLLGLRDRRRGGKRTVVVLRRGHRIWLSLLTLW